MALTIAQARTLVYDYLDEDEDSVRVTPAKVDSALERAMQYVTHVIARRGGRYWGTVVSKTTDANGEITFTAAERPAKILELRIDQNGTIIIAPNMGMIQKYEKIEEAVVVSVSMWGHLIKTWTVDGDPFLEDPNSAQIDDPLLEGAICKKAAADMGLLSRAERGDLLSAFKTELEELVRATAGATHYASSMTDLTSTSVNTRKYGYIYTPDTRKLELVYR